MDSLPLLNMLLSAVAEQWGIFEPVVDSILEEHSHSSRLEVRCPRHEKIVTVLDWLSKRSRDEALDYILGHIDQSQRELAVKFAQSLLGVPDTSDCEAKDLRGILKQIYQTGGLEETADEQKENIISPVDYLLEAFTNRYMSVPFLNILLGRIIYESECINDLQQPASSRLKLRIYSIVAVLVRSKSRTSRDGQTNTSISVFGRVGAQYEETRVEPLRELDGYGSLDHLDIYELVRMTRLEKKRLLMAAFRSNQEKLDRIRPIASRVFDDELFCNEFMASMILLNYIRLETSSGPSREFVYAIVWALFYYYKDSQLYYGGDAAISQPSKDLMKQLAKHTTMKNGCNYKPDLDDYWQIVHMINSLQVIYESYFALNDLLDCPMIRPAPDRWLNGLFIFRLVRLVKCEKDALVEYCRLLPELRCLCRSAYDLVADNLNP